MLLDNMNRTLENAEAGNLFAAISGGGEQTNLPERVPNQQASPSSADKTLESQPEVATVERLNAERLKIRSNLIERCLEVINAHGEFTFEVADLITTVIEKSPEQAEMRATMGGTLVVALTSFLSDDVRQVGKKIASYAHLLALMLQDPQFYKASLEELKDNLGNLLEFVKLAPDHKSEESSPWVAHILLIVEILLSDDAEPRETEWKIPTSETAAIDQPVLKAPELVVSTEDRATLFEAILDMLPRIGKDESLALAVMRILVILTRTRHIAVAMGEKKNIQRLFVMAKQLAGAATPRIQSPLMLILRHIVEDDETIKQIMRSQIKHFLDPGSSRSSRNPDITLYLRAMSHLVVRQPELFVEVNNEMVKLVKWTTTTPDHPGRQQIELQDKYKRTRRGKPEEAGLPTLKPTEELSMEDVKPSTETADGEAAEGSKVEHKVPIVENPDGVIYFLLCELLNYRDVEDKEAAPAPTEDKTKAATTETPAAAITGAEASAPAPGAVEARPASPSKPETKKPKPEFKAEEHPIYIYRCFLLQCLTELLASYNRTKVEFINFKRNAPTHAATPSKPRSNVVNYLLFDLIPSGSLDHAETLAMRKKVSTSSWADSTITALLSKTGEQILDKERDNTDSDDEPDLLFVRKFVLENIIKAYREASTSTEPLDIKYSRMLSLADLMSHIMSGKDNIGGGSDPNVSIRSQQQLKRIMFEKGYIGALTASIADIDLNFPGAKRAVKHILRPLKALTQTAIELSEVGKVALTPGQHDEDEIASASSVSDVDDDREETPDLFRNSTLGMFEPDRDHESSSEGEDGKFKTPGFLGVQY
jgi:E3 ubiquitin-protein ligase HUWE1